MAAYFSIREWKFSKHALPGGLFPETTARDCFREKAARGSLALFGNNMKKLIAAHSFFLLSWLALVFAVSDGGITRAIIVIASYGIGIGFRSSAGIGEGLFRKIISEIPRRERIAMNLRTWGIALIVVGMNSASGAEQVFKSIFAALTNPACAVGFLLVHACYVLKDLLSAKSAAEKQPNKTLHPTAGNAPV